jgi:hypothetical protein
MWLWEVQLHELGFKRKSERYWQCERRYGLPANAHLSLFSWSEQTLPGTRYLVELTEFHVTFTIGLDNIHFYYHDFAESVWTPGGYTSRARMERLLVSPRRLRRQAEALARAFIAGLNGEWQER